MKICKRCGQDETVVNFRLREDGYRPLCRPCEAEMARERRRKKREAKRAATASDHFEITEDPVAVAKLHHSESRAKRDLKREHSALAEELRQKEKVIAELGKLQTGPSIIVYDKAKNERSDVVANAALSDWHVEELVDKEAMHGRNEYNPDIAKQRAERCFQNLLRLVDIHAREATIRTVSLKVIGDMFSGWIHEELLSGTAMAPGEAAAFAKSLLVSGLQFLLKNSSYKFQVICVPGNHGRLTDRIHFNDPVGTSLESYMYSHVADWFRNEPRVAFNVSSTAIVYNQVFEKFTERIMHGYEVRYGGGVGGLSIPLRKWIYRQDTFIPADLTVFGHFHTLDFGGRYLGNGSLIGYNRYAESNGFAYEPPRQAFYLIHARRGGEWCGLNPIWVDEPRPKGSELVVGEPVKP